MAHVVKLCPLSLIPGVVSCCIVHAFYSTTGVLGFELSRFVYSQNSGVRNPYTRVQLALTFRIWARNSAVLALIFGLPLLADEPPGFSLALAPLLACLPAVVDSVADPAGKKHGNNGGVTITHAVPESCTARTNSNSIFTRIVVFTKLDRRWTGYDDAVS